MKTKQKYLSGKRVLLVEDDEVNQMLLKLMIEGQGAESVLEPNKDKALEILQNEEFDLILLDTTLEDVNVLKFTQQLRNKILLTTPIIGMTNINLNGRGLHSGFNHVLKRPVEYKTFVSAVQKLVS